MSSEAVFREAEVRDIPQVVYINRVCLPENYPEYFFYYHLENWPKSFIVAEVNGTIVGYVMTRVETGVSFVGSFIARRGHIVSIAVLEAYRRRGIGERLMRISMDAMKKYYKASEAYLEVRVSNKPAIKLYEKLGFRIVKILKRYYSDGEDAYLMARKL